MITRKIKTLKTAKIIVKGNLESQKISRFIILLHGYGQLAEIFIRNFSVLDEQENVLIVPEALNRFYLEGFSGKVGANWMTKLEREDEIGDQIEYLNNIVQLYKNESWFRSAEKVVFGFSQGTATAVRWILNSDFNPNQLILWGGAFPNDVDFIKSSEISKNCKITICIGDEDEFISEKRLKENEKLLDENEIRHELILYKGKHKIYKEVLKEIFNEE